MITGISEDDKRKKIDSIPDTECCLLLKCFTFFHPLFS